MAKQIIFTHQVSIKSLLITCVLLLPTFAQNSSDGLCGTLYAEPSPNGLSFRLNHQDQSTDLAADQRAVNSTNGWETTRSIVVENSCVLRVCNDTYLDGTCQNFQRGSHSGQQNAILAGAMSVYCNCDKVTYNLFQKLKIVLKCKL